MITDFTVLCATTVPGNYTWDNSGLPLATSQTQTPAYTTLQYTSGYAPALNVIFNNTSVSDVEFEYINYNWNFGDYYHDTNNTVSLTCVSLIEHLYIMPGKYTVTLEHKQARNKSSVTFGANFCKGKYDIRWFWTALECSSTENRTWDETRCTRLTSVPTERWKPKWWDDEAQCFQKYCKFWSWYELANQPGRANPVKWTDTGSEDVFEKKWMREDNETQCSLREFDYASTIEVQEQSVIKVGVVEVKEILPVAGLTCITRPITGISPFTVQLSPSACKSGSFPIERIDWDFGDGSPIKTIVRYGALTGSDILFTNNFLDDQEDIRNFDVLHTYNRTANSYAVFYPSITCYSANTHSYDSCSTTVGPILFPNPPNTTLIKVRNTLKGNVYAINVDDNVAFLTNTQNETINTTTINEPQNVLKDSIVGELEYTGQPGTGFPPDYEVICKTSLVETPANYLATEDNDPYTPDPDPNPDEPGVPILTQENIYLIP